MHNQNANNRTPSLQLTASPARPNRAATGAELAAVLLDQRGVAALLADFAGQCFDAGGFAFLFRDFHHAHVQYWIAVFIQDAEHRVAVNDQFGDVGNCRGVAFHLDAAGHARHEIAERFAEVEQLA